LFLVTIKNTEPISKTPNSNNDKSNANTDFAVVYSKNSLRGDLTISLGVDRIDNLGSNIWDIRNLSYDDTTMANFKTWITGKTIYFELSTPTIEQDDSYKFQELTDIDDWGTQEFLYDNDITIPVPSGNEFFYPVDYKAFIDSLGGREDIDYDASEVVSKTELANYLTTITGYDASKTQTLKNVSGTLTWVDDE